MGLRSGVYGHMGVERIILFYLQFVWKITCWALASILTINVKFVALVSGQCLGYMCRCSLVLMVQWIWCWYCGWCWWWCVLSFLFNPHKYTWIVIDLKLVIRTLSYTRLGKVRWKAKGQILGSNNEAQV